MKVTKELIQKYWEDRCTPKEKEVIEHWLAAKARESTDLDLATMDRSEDRVWDRFNENIIPDYRKPTKVIPLYKKVARYAAAACLAAMFFGAGYFVDKETSDQVVQNEQKKDRGLRIYGENGAYAKIPGDAFKLSFEGQLRLHNGSNSLKTVIVGEMIHILEPGKSYYLNGSVDGSSMLAINSKSDMDRYLKGDFRLAVIKS